MPEFQVEIAQHAVIQDLFVRHVFQHRVDLLCGQRQILDKVGSILAQIQDVQFAIFGLDTSSVQQTVRDAASAVVLFKGRAGKAEELRFVVKPAFIHAKRLEESSRDIDGIHTGFR